MDLQQLIAQYGYLALFVLTFFQGETVLLVAGAAAFKGYISLPEAIGVACLGSFLGDEATYAIGRYNRDFLQRRFPSWNDRVERIHVLLKRHRILLILTFRYFYGFRYVTPFAIGTAGVAPRTFLVLNGAGALIWAVSFGIGGYFLGDALEALFRDFGRAQMVGLGVLAAAGLVYWRLKRRRAAKRREGHEDKAPARRKTP